MNFLFAGIKWGRFLIIILLFPFKLLHEQGRSFGVIAYQFLSQIFSSSLVLTLMVPPGFKFYRRFWVFVSVAVLVVYGLGR